jgi:hypothetical protein
MSKPFVWSFTALKEAEKCPKAFHERYIAKTVPYVETKAMRDGKEVHTAFESRIRDGVPFPTHLSHLDLYVPDVSDPDIDFFTEYELGADRDFHSVNFHDRDVYIRGKLDFVMMDRDLACLFDWKTGKVYEDDDELQFHGALLKARHPSIKHWRGWYVWLRERRVGQEHVLSPARTFQRIAERIAIIDPNNQLAHPNKLCPWCPVSSCAHFTGEKGR